MSTVHLDVIKDLDQVHLAGTDPVMMVMMMMRVHPMELICMLSILSHDLSMIVS